jgi:hypothetical protein
MMPRAAALRTPGADLCAATPKAWTVTITRWTGNRGAVCEPGAGRGVPQREDRDVRRRHAMTLDDHADAYRQVKEAWKDATEARQITMLDDLQDLLDGIGFDDDAEDELRGRVERLMCATRRVVVSPVQPVGT